MWQINRNYNRLDDFLCGIIGRRKMSALGTAGDHGDSPWQFRNRVIVSGTHIVLRDGLHHTGYTISRKPANRWAR